MIITFSNAISLIDCQEVFGFNEDSEDTNCSLWKQGLVLCLLPASLRRGCPHPGWAPGPMKMDHPRNIVSSPFTPLLMTLSSMLYIIEQISEVDHSMPEWIPNCPYCKTWPMGQSKEPLHSGVSLASTLPLETVSHPGVPRRPAQHPTLIVESINSIQ